MSSSVLLHHQRSPEDLQQHLAWYKIRDTIVGQNCVKQDIKKAFELAAVCKHPNAVWLTNLFGGRDTASREEARQVFLSCENDPRALSLAGALVRDFGEIRRAAELGDAFAQAVMAEITEGEESFRWAEECAAQGERNGFCHVGRCYRDGVGCEEDAERAKANFLVAAELWNVDAMVYVGKMFGREDAQRFVWFGRAAVSGYSFTFLSEMLIRFRTSLLNMQMLFLSFGRALRGHINNEKRTIFGNPISFDTRIGPANEALRFYEFQMQSY
jgi:hypothetical protein